MLPLTKCLHPMDYEHLQPELAIVHAFQPEMQEQHPHRAWEYALALQAIKEWRLKCSATLTCSINPLAFDIGGAGSPLHKMVELLGVTCHVVDPRVNVAVETLAKNVPPQSVQVVLSISTIEHTEDPQGFVDALAGMVMPGGLLFLTMDIWGEPADRQDSAHFHWDRHQIFSIESWMKLTSVLHDLGFSLLGSADWTYNGNHVYDYSFCSLAVVRQA